MKLDVLAFAAHPDDVEISCGASIAKLVSEGKKVGIIDLTMGQLGSRGSAELRLKEAQASAKILSLSIRENLGMEDGFFDLSMDNKLAIIRMVRKYQPDIVLANSTIDRHPDHGRASQLVSEACFLSGLRKIETESDGNKQGVHRPKAVYHYIQDYWIQPDFVVDSTAHWETKMKSIMAFSSQFYDPNSADPETPISGEDFFDFLRSRAMQFGRPAGVRYAEGFTVERYPLVNDLTKLG